MAIHIGRREFIVTLGGAAAWPLVARAQQGAKVYRLGYPISKRRVELSRDVCHSICGSPALGWTEGKNVVFERRYADNRLDRLPEAASRIWSNSHFR